MNKRTKAQIESLQKAHSFLEENKNTFAGFVPLTDSITEFNQGLEELDKLNEERAIPKKGIKMEKVNAFNEMVFQALSLGKKGYVWAKKNNKTLFLSALDVERSDFTGSSVAEAIQVARNVEKVLRPNLASLAPYRITMHELEALRTAINIMSESRPRLEQKQTHSHPLDQKIITKVRMVGDQLNDVEDLIVGEYLKKDPTLVNNFLASRRVEDPGTRSTILKLAVSDQNGERLDGVFCDVLEMADEEQYTNPEGVAEIWGMKSGTLTLLFSKEGYSDQKVPFSIERGERREVKAVLGKVS